ncbi:response regulator [Phormidesmis sp. 146-33]
MDFNHQHLPQKNGGILNKIDNPPLILIAEDEEIIRLAIAETLKQNGYAVVETENGWDCLRAFKIFRPDLVILDGQMPQMDGFTCCQIIRTFSYCVPILMVTGLHSADFIDQALAVGVTSYLTKPVPAKALIQRVSSLLQAKRSSCSINSSN